MIYRVMFREQKSILSIVFLHPILMWFLLVLVNGLYTYVSYKDRYS